MKSHFSSDHLDKNDVELSNFESSNVEQEANAEAGRLSRRRWLKNTGGAALLLPLVQIAGCSDDAPAKPAAAAPKPAAAAPQPSAAAAPKPAPAPAEVTPAAAEPSAAPAAGGSGGLVKIDVNDPVAQALSYSADAADVDSSKHPRFTASQNCGNCAQYKAQGEDGWGSCAIFPGKLVAKKAWCAGYIAVS